MKALEFSTTSEAINYIKTKGDKQFVMFSDTTKTTELANSGSSNLISCSTSGEYSPNGYKNGIITGFECDKGMVDIVELSSPPAKNLKQLKESYNNVKNNKNAFALLLCDGLSGMEETILTTLYFIDDQFKIIGGSAGDNLKFEDTRIYNGNNKVHSVVVFFDCKQKTFILKENIYLPSEKRMLVTDADVIKRTVKTFNNRPASEEYARLLGVNEKDLGQYFMNNPLGKMYGDSIDIASPMKVNSDKSITFYCQIVPNTFVNILEAADPVDIIQKTVASIPFQPSFVFAINCILRSLKFQKENLWKSVDKALLGMCSNTTGFVSYGEQFHKVHFNQTMVLLLVE